MMTSVIVRIEEAHFLNCTYPAKTVGKNGIRTAELCTTNLYYPIFASRFMMLSPRTETRHLLAS